MALAQKARQQSRHSRFDVVVIAFGGQLRNHLLVHAAWRLLGDKVVKATALGPVEFRGMREGGKIRPDSRGGRGGRWG